MKWIRDSTGRFPHRPHYEFTELDQECEGIVAAYLHSRHRAIEYPVSTNDLTILLERETSDLDLYADLGSEGDAVEGLTDFHADRMPSVRIARELTEQPWRENRLRTTLTHELAHVRFHNALWTAKAAQIPLFDDQFSRQPPRCKRDTMLVAAPYDWMEWQAGYACGAFLMPLSSLRAMVSEVLECHGLFGPAALHSQAGGALIRQVQARFQVSADAAKIRLVKLGHLTEHSAAPPPPLF